MGQVGLGDGADRSAEIGREIGNGWVRSDWGMGWTGQGNRECIGQVGRGNVMDRSEGNRKRNKEWMG